MMVMMMVMMVLSFLMNEMELIIYLMVMLFIMYKYMFVYDLNFSFFFFEKISIVMMMLSVWIIMMMLMTLKKIKMKTTMMSNIIIMISMLMLCFSVVNMVMFYFFFEVVLIPIFMMIMNWGGQMERYSAGMYMILYTIFGSLPLLLLLVSFFWESSLSMIMMMVMSSMKCSNMEYVFLMVCFLVKMPMYGLHMWLPKAHVEAPVMGSMILAGVLLKLGGYGIYRIMGFVNLIYLESLIDMFMVISIVGGLYISMMCMMNVDIKVLIANSSVVHMSMVIGGLLTGNMMMYSGVLLMMVGHGVCSSALFCISNFYYERFYTRNMMMLKGMEMLFPSMGFCFLMMNLINMGFPPFMNMMSEIFLVGSMIKFSLLLMMVLMMMYIMSGFYSIYLYSCTQHGKLMFMSSVKSMNIREYNLFVYHFVVLIIFILKMEIFF